MRYLHMLNEHHLNLLRTNKNDINPRCQHRTYEMIKRYPKQLQCTIGTPSLVANVVAALWRQWIIDTLSNHQITILTSILWSLETMQHVVFSYILLLHNKWTFSITHSDAMNQTSDASHFHRSVFTSSTSKSMEIYPILVIINKFVPKQR